MHAYEKIIHSMKRLAYWLITFITDLYNFIIQAPNSSDSYLLLTLVNAELLKAFGWFNVDSYDMVIIN